MVGSQATTEKSGDRGCANVNLVRTGCTRLQDLAQRCDESGTPKGDAMPKRPLYRAGAKSQVPASMADVAALAGVSVATVSRALRGSPLVRAATRERVLAAAEQLSFSVFRAASSLATGRLGRIAVLLGGRLGSWFNGSVLDAMYTPVHEAGHELLIYRIGDAEERRRFLATLPARRNADAMVVASFALTPPEHRRLRDLAMPVVYLNQRVRGAPSVAVDDVAGARLATRHLLNLGHRRLAFVQGDRRIGFAYSAIARVDGFTAELEAAGVPAAARQVLAAGGGGSAEEVVATLLSRGRRPTGIVTESDEIAVGLLAALSRAGLRVPEDVSVVGFDDAEYADRFDLTTVAQPVEVLGLEAARMALALAAGDRLRRRELDVPTRLVLRRSTAPPPPAPRPP